MLLLLHVAEKQEVLLLLLLLLLGSGRSNWANLAFTKHSSFL